MWTPSSVFRYRVSEAFSSTHHSSARPAFGSRPVDRDPSDPRVRGRDLVQGDLEVSGARSHLDQADVTPGVVPWTVATTNVFVVASASRIRLTLLPEEAERWSRRSGSGSFPWTSSAVP